MCRRVCARTRRDLRVIVVATSAALTVTIEGKANGKTISLAPSPTAIVPGSIDGS